MRELFLTMLVSLDGLAGIADGNARSMILSARRRKLGAGPMRRAAIRSPGRRVERK